MIHDLTNNTFPTQGLMRLHQVLNLLPVSKSYFFGKVSEGTFPKPIKLGRISMWKAEDIHDLINQISMEGEQYEQ